MRKEGCPVSAKMLELKALEIAADVGISSESFSALYSWRRRFMRKHKLSVRVRTRQGQTTPEDDVAARTKFRGEVRAAIVEHNIIQVFNADQTAVFFEYLPRKTITTRGEKTVWVECSGKDKERATAMLLADRHDNKRAPFLVFKAGVSRHRHVQEENDSKWHGFGVRLWKEIAPLQAKHDCQIYGNPIAWWNTDISVKFLDYRDNMHGKILLLSLNTLRQSTLSLLKSHHAIHMYVKVVQLQEKPPRMAFEMVAPKRHEITAWIAELWSELSADTIVSGFAKTELLTDTRSPVVAKDHDNPQDISDVLNQLADLGVADETGVSGDELFSSDSSDNE
ncbi:hypothetical protein L914_11628 [Phytophthora nicotianae]|uniref:HTH CENPB-type domain-containing protein n=2 Tax=Phytophthora nicotianae TaxID=4792 RepID=V9EUC2_PHYNI|nr:hypothetical protein F443_12081 [Phytophthora nicotianae P1569]ETM42774.1 hypothetical protein L914_11628 [Phytophthora nicotianae]